MKPWNETSTNANLSQNSNWTQCGSSGKWQRGENTRVQELLSEVNYTELRLQRESNSIPNRLICRTWTLVKKFFDSESNHLHKLNSDKKAIRLWTESPAGVEL